MATAQQEGNPDYAQFLAVALQAAREAGAVIADAWDKAKQVEHKGAVDLVTETDKRCEALVHAHLSAAFPSHRFIGEEESAAQGFTDQLTDDPTWMVDPVDGTTNFVHRFPFSCVSIALVIGRRPVVGVVLNPVLGELFHATLGGGAFLNGARIATSDTRALGHALVATEVGTRRDDATMDACFGRLRALGAASRGVRCCGSCALNLCGVAVGRLDAYFEIGLGGCWDLAAGVLVLEEAGGKVLDPEGGPFGLMGRRVLGTNAHLGAQVAAVLAAVGSAPAEPQPPA